MSAQRGRKFGRTISRDTLSFIGGWGLMVYEAVRANPFNLAVFIGGMFAAGVPGVVEALSAWNSMRTEQQSSDSPSDPSSSPSRT